MKKPAKPEIKPVTGRDEKGRLVPGVSGNPGGRPKSVEEFRSRARKAVDKHVLEMWQTEVSKKGKDWVKCSELLAAYGYGRPTQAIDVTADVFAEVKPVNPDDTAPQLTRDERRAELRMHLAREALVNSQAREAGEPTPFTPMQLPEETKK